MEPVHESASHNSKKENTEANRNYTSDHEHSPTISLMDSKHDSPGTIAADTKFPVNERTVGWVENSKAARSLSSSSSNSSLEDLFEMDPKSLTPISSPKPQIHVHDIETPKTEKPGNWTPGATSSPTCNGTHEPWTNNSTSATQYPPMQVMDRTAGYDPHRLPSSIFARNSSNSMGWSITSNESLFSLNFGNNSFPRDHSLVFEELQNGEYYKPDEHHNESDELNWFGQPHPPPLEEENGISDDDKDEVLDKKSEGKISRDETVHEVKVHSSYESSNSNSPTANYEPDGSGTSSTKPDVMSRKKKYAWRFCECTNCRWNFLYGFKRKQKPCSISSEESLRNKEARNKTVEKKGSDSVECTHKPSPKKSSSSFLTRPCSFWSCC